MNLPIARFLRRMVIPALAGVSASCAPQANVDSVREATLPREEVVGEEMQGTALTGEVPRFSQHYLQYRGHDQGGKSFKGIYIVDNTLEADWGNGIRLKGKELTGVIIEGKTDAPALQPANPPPGPAFNLEVRIDEVTRPGTTVDAENDPAGTVTRTYLYKLSARRWVNGAWTAWDSGFCDTNRDFSQTNVWLDSQLAADPSDPQDLIRRARLEYAMPVAATWNDHGDISTLTDPNTKEFSFACMGGVVAKCHREEQGGGYHAWRAYHGVTSQESAVLMQTCTRAFRADYCGDGTVFTVEGTPINIFDDHNIRVDDWVGPAVPPLLTPATGTFNAANLATTARLATTTAVDATAATNIGIFNPRPRNYFEAGWSTDGAHCLAHSRWKFMSPEFCKNPGLAPFYDSIDGTAHPCDTPAEARSQGVGFFNESESFPLPPQWPQRTLNVTVQRINGATGNVVERPNALGVGITCGSDCTEKYPYTEPVPLQVTGGRGPTVTWSGCTPTQEGYCVADMTVDRTVTATLTCPIHCVSTCYSSCMQHFWSNPITCQHQCLEQCVGCNN